MTTLAPSLAVDLPAEEKIATGAHVRERERIGSIDALRGVVIFVMLFVNRLAGDAHVPAWLQHHEGKGSGLTFVDLVFPAFLFIAGMAIPFAFSSRLKRGESVASLLGHVVLRWLSLLLLGVMMVNGRPDGEKTGLAPMVWEFWMYLCAIATFLTIQPPAAMRQGGLKAWRIANVALRIAGLAGLVYMAFLYRGPQDQRIISLSPFYVTVQWWGILGHIGWAYLAASIVFLCFRRSQAAIVTCMALMVGIYIASAAGAFAGFPPARIIGVEAAFGSHALLTTAGVLLGMMLMDRNLATPTARLKYTLWYCAGFGAAAFLLAGAYGIRKNSATPSWALIGCVATALLWLILYFIGDVLKFRTLTRPAEIAGQNVLLAYLIAAVFSPTLNLLGVLNWYYRVGSTDLTAAILRATGTAVVVLVVTTVITRAGGRLRL
jgi:heparan-alpha-glucosaminide N-acetyltransferase